MNGLTQIENCLPKFSIYISNCTKIILLIFFFEILSRTFSVTNKTFDFWILFIWNRFIRNYYYRMKMWETDYLFLTSYLNDHSWITPNLLYYYYIFIFYTIIDWLKRCRIQTTQKKLLFVWAVLNRSDLKK